VRVIQTIADLRAALPANRPVCLVPTMGNLHEGHLSLVRVAREHLAHRHLAGERAGLVVASIFVNPLQFAPHEDFAKYPRTFERDCALLADSGCEIAFAPEPQEIYPEAQDFKVQPPAALAEILEGAVRPGFFTGVCTVVLKLFNIVRPNAAVFGKKDYQQLLVVANMVRQFNLPIEIIAGETVREASGLALSSRNGYLNDGQRTEAAQLRAALLMAGSAARSGSTDWPHIEQASFDFLAKRGWQPDYVAIRNRSDLSAPRTAPQGTAAPRSLVVLGAARLGGTRLIDNLEL
jgi:pantoate--beta-alanine ligase